MFSSEFQRTKVSSVTVCVGHLESTCCLIHWRGLQVSIVLPLLPVATKIQPLGSAFQSVYKCGKRKAPVCLVWSYLPVMQASTHALQHQNHHQIDNQGQKTDWNKLFPLYTTCIRKIVSCFKSCISLEWHLFSTLMFGKFCSMFWTH